VYILDIDEAEMKNVQKQFNDEYCEGAAMCLKCDVTSQEEFENAVEQVFKKQNRLDILCNNAGTLPTSDIKKFVDTNLTSVIRGTLLALKYMDTNNGGSGGNIIQMGSMSGLSYSPYYCEYTATKHGIIGFTKGFAKEALSRGVRLNCMCPSCVDTDMLKTLTQNPVMKQAVDAMGVQTVDVVAKGFMQLLQDEEKVGEVMRITVKNGIDFHKFPEEPVPM
ncbi:15-hydroxyprostaglandin dehydrogenase [NAD(+)]-like, partial [Paramuricea clavata]